MADFFSTVLSMMVVIIVLAVIILFRVLKFIEKTGKTLAAPAIILVLAYFSPNILKVSKQRAEQVRKVWRDMETHDPDA